MLRREAEHRHLRLYTGFSSHLVATYPQEAQVSLYGFETQHSHVTFASQTSCGLFVSVLSCKTVMHVNSADDCLWWIVFVVYLAYKFHEISISDVCSLHWHADESRALRADVIIERTKDLHTDTPGARVPLWGRQPCGLRPQKQRHLGDFCAFNSTDDQDDHMDEEEGGDNWRRAGTTEVACFILDFPVSLNIIFGGLTCVNKNN